jgi:hypothetical protein
MKTYDAVQVKLNAGFPPQWPGFIPGSSHVGFCDGQKRRWGRFSPRTSVSPANLHPICFSTIIIFTITRGWHNRPRVAAVPIASQSRIKEKVKLNEFSNSALNGGGQLHGSATLTSPECWVRPRVFFCPVAKRKILPSSDNQTSVIQPVASHSPTELLCTKI